MVRRSRREPLTQYQTATLKRYLDDAAKLPEAGEVWLREEIGLGDGALNAFSRTDIIVKDHRDDEFHTRKHWRTSKGVVEWVENRLAGRQTTPCGNGTGIYTIEVGTYTCSDETCDCRMDRETAEAVVA